MVRTILFGFICVLMLITMTGISMAEEAPVYVVYVQGDEPSITEGSDGNMNV